MRRWGFSTPSSPTPSTTARRWSRSATWLTWTSPSTRNPGLSRRTCSSSLSLVRVSITGETSPRKCQAGASCTSRTDTTDAWEPSRRVWRHNSKATPTVRIPTFLFSDFDFSFFNLNKSHFLLSRFFFVSAVGGTKALPKIPKMVEMKQTQIKRFFVLWNAKKLLSLRFIGSEFLCRWKDISHRNLTFCAVFPILDDFGLHSFKVKKNKIKDFSANAQRCVHRHCDGANRRFRALWKDFGETCFCLPNSQNAHYALFGISPNKPVRWVSCAVSDPTVPFFRVNTHLWYFDFSFYNSYFILIKRALRSFINLLENISSLIFFFFAFERDFCFFFLESNCNSFKKEKENIKRNNLYLWTFFQKYWKTTNSIKCL